MQIEPEPLERMTLNLTEGGPVADLFERLMLTHEGRARDAVRVAQIVALGSWLPLVFLAAIDGVLFSGQHFPLLYDFGQHVRFLFSLPILILADIPIGEQVQSTISQLISGGLVAKEKERDFAAVIESSIRLRDSWLTTAMLIGIIIALGWWTVSSQMHLGNGTWMEPVAGGSFSKAGYWYAFVALPVYQFFVLRWGFRIIVWGSFCFRLAKMDLLLTATHPDRAGGIGFLGRSIVPFGMIGLALSAVSSTTIAARVLFAGEDFYRELPGYGILVALILGVAIGSLLFFSPKLVALKYEGLKQYSRLATAYTLAFQRRWLSPDAVRHEDLLGSADIQSLADLGNSF